jgi:glycosyltransferase involved in cell wall biosynthesis
MDPDLAQECLDNEIRNSQLIKSMQSRRRLEMKSPLVTVFMPLYNAENHVAEAIESILTQEFSDFEFLIINDGSTDSSATIASSYSDPRIRLVHNEANKGLVYTANRGFDLAQGTYIARMDSDDISLPQRLIHQIRFMEKHPQIGICGSTIQYFGARSGKMRCVCEPDSIKATLFWSTALAQPVVMMRRAELERHNLRYDAKFRYGAEDYALWNEASRCFPLANLPEILLRYRINPTSISHTHSNILLNNTIDIIKSNFTRLGYPFDGEVDFIIRNNIMAGSPIQDMDKLKYFEQILQKLRRLNESTQLYPITHFNKTLGEKLFRVCVKSPHLGMEMLHFYRKSSVGGFSRLTFEQRIRLISKAVGNSMGL